MTTRNYTALPHEYLEEMQELSDAEYGRLIRALQKYSMSGEMEKLCGNERFYVKRVCNREDRYQAEFAEAAKKKSTSGKRGAESRWNGKDGNAISDDSKNGNAISSDGKNSDAIFQDGKNGYTNTDTETDTDTELSTAVAVDNAPATAAVRNPAVARVMTEFMDKINPTPSPMCCDELLGFAEVLGAEVCVYAFHKALDEKCTKWSYIRGILRNFAADGVRCLADIQVQDKKHQVGRAKDAKKGKGDQYQTHGGALSDLERQAVQRALQEDGA